ncbi:tRNA (adenosine(37)-N6)-threonylcarbamoyltransferase complex dimerization subunit type 1 TsaB [Chloroflexota bacterium]
MKVLGIDTSGYANAIGVVDGERVLADFNFEARADSLEKIITNIDSALKKVSLTLGDIEGFGVGLGPGSWTGIRVGVTVAKILAFSTGKPVAGVPTLEALAYKARHTPGLICSIISAGIKDMVYAAFYSYENGSVSRKGDYYVGDVLGLSEMVKEPMVLIGAEAETYRRIIRQASSYSDIGAIADVPDGSVVALLARTRLERGENNDVLSLTPLYLKESTARAFSGKYAMRAKAKGQE